MCGIFGLITKPGSKYQNKSIRKTLENIAVFSESRGKDSSGMAIRNPKSGTIEVIKGDIPIRQLLKSKAFNREIKTSIEASAIGAGFATFGHARLVTNGTQLNEVNNQPVLKDDIIVIHNGIIVNAEELWQQNPQLQRNYSIDTEIIPALIRHELNSSNDLPDACNKVFNQLEGTFSVAMMFHDLDQFVLATNNGSLYYITDKHNFITFASEAFFLEKLKKDPWFIRCYPTPLLFLSRQYEEISKGVKSSSLKAINTTGSTLSTEVREEVERIFGVKIFDSYSCEGGAMFFECPTHSFYHASEETAIQEYLEDSFTLANPDRPMRHITTDLNNYATPFIRYDTQDYVVLGNDELCTCGRHFRNIKSIKGRDSDILITPSGKYLIVENFVAYFEWIGEVDQIQVVQNKIDEIIIRIIVNDRFSDSVFSKVLEYWKSYIGSDVEVVLEVVEKIDLTPTGKRRTVIRNPEIKIDGGA